MADKCRVEFSNRQKDVAANKQLRDLIRACCAQTLRREGVEFPCLVSVSFVTKDEIRRLNSQSRGVDAVTDVLSFPLGQDGKYDRNESTGAVLLGDIVISMPKAFEQADTFGHSLQREVGFLTVHSMFHLLGYDHEEGGLAAVRMREKEETVLTMLGIPRGASYVMGE